MKLFIFAILILVAFQVHAKDGVNKVDHAGKSLLDKGINDEKHRLERLEMEVSRLGAERERARAAKQEATTTTQIKRNVHGVNGSKKFDFSEIEKRRLEKLETEVSKLGAERERARAAKQP